MEDKPKRKVRVWLIVLGLLVLFFGLMIFLMAYFFMGAARTALSNQVENCSTRECFIASANSCTSALWTSQEEIGTVSYATAQCKFMKTIESVSANELPEVKSLIEGKSFICPYPSGKFNVNWTDTLTQGVESCRGDLKDAIGELLLFS